MYRCVVSFVQFESVRKKTRVPGERPIFGEVSWAKTAAASKAAAAAANWIEARSVTRRNGNATILADFFDYGELNLQDLIACIKHLPFPEVRIDVLLMIRAEFRGRQD